MPAQIVLERLVDRGSSRGSSLSIAHHIGTSLGRYDMAGTGKMEIVQRAGGTLDAQFPQRLFRFRPQGAVAHMSRIHGYKVVAGFVPGDNWAAAPA